LKHVHHDVSTSNILHYQGGERLSDLEFLKELSSLQSHEVKTVCLPVFLLADSVNIDVKGIQQFMAVEIEHEMYCFRPVNGAPLHQWLELLLEGKHQKQPPTHSVLFNPLHDHKSVWWIACWALLHYIPADHIPLHDKRLREQVNYARRLFHPMLFTPQ